MTIKIRWIDRTAIKEPGKPWKSENPYFAASLNEIAIPERVRGYTPNMESALIELAQEFYSGLEVLEGPEPTRYSDLDKVVY